MKKYVLVCGTYGFTLHKSENYKARISDARDCWKFEKCNGFESTEDVLEYVEQYFKINRNEIEVKEG